MTVLDRLRRACVHPLPWILMMAALLRWQAAGALRSSDDLDYAMGARDLLEGRYRPESFHQLRLGVVVPAAAAFALLGVRPVAAVVWPMATSLLSIAVLYALVARRSSRAVASLAALLLAVSTQHVLSGAELFPDAPLTFWLLLSLLLYWREREGERRPAAYALAGVCFYAAFATRIEALKFGPAFGAIEAWFFRKRGADRNVLWLAAGALAPMILEAGFFAVVTGHPFERVREVTAVEGWTHSSGARNMGLWPMLKSLVSPFGAFGIAFPVAAAGAARLLRERRLGIVLFAGGYALATALLGAGLFLLADGRFYTFLSPFVAWFAAEAVSSIPRERVRIALAAALVVAGTLLVHSRLPADTARAFAELRETLAARHVPYYSDHRTVASMAFYYPGPRGVAYGTESPRPPCWLVDHGHARAIDRAMYGYDPYPGDRGAVVRSIPLTYRGLPGFSAAARLLFRGRGVGVVEEIRVFRME